MLAACVQPLPAVIVDVPNRQSLADVRMDGVKALLHRAPHPFLWSWNDEMINRLINLIKNKYLLPVF